MHLLPPTKLTFEMLDDVGEMTGSRSCSLLSLQSVEMQTMARKELQFAVGPEQRNVSKSFTFEELKRPDKLQELASVPVLTSCDSSAPLDASVFPKSFTIYNRVEWG